MRACSNGCLDVRVVPLQQPFEKSKPVVRPDKPLMHVITTICLGHMKLKVTVRSPHGPKSYGPVWLTQAVARFIYNNQRRTDTRHLN